MAEPFDAAVVSAVHNAEAAIPNRASFPSMLPPGCAAVARWSTPAGVNSGLPACSTLTAPTSSGTKISVIAASSAHPCFVFPTIRPNR